MIDLVTKFIQWIKDMVSLTVGLPATISGWISACNSFLSWLPFNLGSIITGLLQNIQENSNSNNGHNCPC